jgi:hypothetical protein
MRLLFVGGLWAGSTTVHRLRAFQRLSGIDVTALDSGDRSGRATLLDRIAHRVRRPIDWRSVNTNVLEVARRVRPDVVFFDNIRVVHRHTLRRLQDDLSAHTAFYTPDNVIAPHNSSRQLEGGWKNWSVVFTTKRFNVPDLVARGVPVAHLIGNAFDPETHRPMLPQEVGQDFERFDVAFAGVMERARRQAINRIASNGFSAVVFGDAAQWGTMHQNVVVRPLAWDLDYSRAMHTGKVALCFLRHLNSDTVTTRSVELPAMGRPMVAERTSEHDSMFKQSEEYLAFSSENELVAGVRSLIQNDARRFALGQAGRRRCVISGYSTVNRAREMVEVLESVMANV